MTKPLFKSEGVFYTRSGYHIICNVLIHIIQIIKKCISEVVHPLHPIAKSRTL